MTSIKNHAVAFTVSIVLLLAFGAWEIFKYEIVPKRFGIVERGKIYRSGRLAPRLLRKTLQQYNIQVVIDLTEPEPNDAAGRAEQETVARLGLTYFNFPLAGDGTGNITNYARALAAIARARSEERPILVHCAAGTQRTGGVMAAYRLLVEKCLAATAWAELTRFGWQPGKDKILLEYLNARLAELAARLQELQVIGRPRGAVPQIAP